MQIIPKYFFTPSIIEARKPLGENARRAGWQGCNIIFGDVPEQGRISIIKDRQIIKEEIIIDNIEKTIALKENDISKRGWLFDILKCVNSIHKSEFTLQEMYNFQDVLKNKHISNNNIKPKIRQQLQILRNKGYIEFLGNGNYKKVK